MNKEEGPVSFLQHLRTFFQQIERGIVHGYLSPLVIIV